MLEDERCLDGIGTGKVGRGILRRVRIHGQRRLTLPGIQVKTAGNGTRGGGEMHRRVEGSNLNAIPEGTPYKPGLVVIVDDKVRVDGVPVVALFTRADNAALVVPQAISQLTGREQSDGRAILVEGGTAVGKPPAPVPLDDIRGPHMMAEAWHRIVSPLRNDRHHRLRIHCPRRAVGGSHVLYAEPRTVEMPGALLTSHHWVVNQLWPLCHRHDTEP